MLIYEDILSHFSSGAESYVIDKYNLIVEYKGYIEYQNIYLHDFTLTIKGFNETSLCRSISKTNDVKDISLDDFGEKFTKSLSHLLYKIQDDILKDMGRNKL